MVYLQSSLLIFILSFQLSTGQKRYLFKTYTVNDGLSDNTVFDINQDSKGYLWIATDGGISKFDGHTFDNSVIPEVNQNQLFTSMISKGANNKIAIATFLNGVMVEQDNSSFKQYLLHPKQLGKNVVRAVQWVSDTKILFTQSRNINVIDRDSVYQLYDCGVNKNMFQTTEFDTNSNIWFGGIDGLGVLLKEENYKNPHYIPELKGKYVMKLLFAHKNKMLIGTRDGYWEMTINSVSNGILDYKLERKFTEFNNKVINHIYTDKHKNVWISFASDGVCQIKEDKIIRWITYETGLPTQGVMCTFQDNEENYWFGTTEGVSRLYSLTDYSFTYDNKQLPGMDYFCIDPYGRLLFSDNQAVFTIINNKIQTYTLKNTPFENEQIISSTFKNGIGYFFTNDAIYTMECSQKLKWNNINKIVDFNKNGLYDLKSYYFDNNELFLGFVDGLYVVRNGNTQKVDIRSDKTLRLRPRAIIKDIYGNFWLGDYTFGFHHFKNEGENKQGIPVLKHLQSYESLKPDSAFATAWIQDMMMDKKGNIWLSSLFTGVYKLTIDAGGVQSAMLYSTKDGLSSNDVTQIVEGKDNSVWFATRNGADRLVIESDSAEKIYHYNEKNGFGRKVNKILCKDSVTYISYENGFYAIDNDISKLKIEKPLEVVISRISVMGKNEIEALSYINGDRYFLNYNQNALSFDFSVVRLKDNEGLEYQYKLEGADDDWSEFSDRRYAAYVALEPGNYTFMVRAKIINHELEQSVTQFKFRIKHPYYKTWWFITIVILMPIVVVMIFYRYKIKQMLKLQRVREKIASDLHDDIGSSLSSISIMCDLLQMQLDNTSRAEQMIKDIGSNAHSILESMDDIIWSVNPQNDKFENLILRIKEFAIPLFELKDINFIFIVSNELNSLTMPIDVRRNVYLIVKEAINNLIKHSGSSDAKIEFLYEFPYLHIKIEDNGHGFDCDKICAGSNGIKNMKKRAEQIYADISIKSDTTGGTSIILSVKII